MHFYRVAWCFLFCWFEDDRRVRTSVDISCMNNGIAQSIRFFLNVYCKKTTTKHVVILTANILQSNSFPRVGQVVLELPATPQRDKSAQTLSKEPVQSAKGSVGLRATPLFESFLSYFILLCDSPASGKCGSPRHHVITADLLSPPY